MSARHIFDRSTAMASRWRRRRPCALAIGDRVVTGALRDISGNGAWLDLIDPPAIGTEVELRHPEVGAITGRVAGLRAGGFQLAFDGSERSVAFALAAIVSDMTSAN